VPGDDGQIDPLCREKTNTTRRTNQYPDGARPKTALAGAQHVAAALKLAEPRGLPSPVKASFQRTYPPRPQVQIR